MSHQHAPSTSSKEKYDTEKTEDVDLGLQEVIDVRDDDGELLLPERREQAERDLVHKLDFRLMPAIIILFILKNIDRAALTSARLKGLEQDLNLTDTQYETVLAVLYASYIPAQLPSNMILNRITRPAYYTTVCVCLWGMGSALNGVTKNYAGILAARIFVGLSQAGFYPGAIYLFSRWYTRKELALRSAILYGGLLVSNAFGSLMAAGILTNMEGKLGVRAWRWLFYIEGAITVFAGLTCVWALPDYPHNTRWLSKPEKRLAQVRLAEDAGEADEDADGDTAYTGMKQALQDPKVYLLTLMACAEQLGLSFVNFFPTLTATLGFSTTITLVLAAPPWIFATVVCCLNAWHADRTGERFFHNAAPWWGVIIAYIIGVSTSSVGGRYVALFLMASGYAGFALLSVWTSNAIPRPPAKRAAAIGIVNGVGNLGNLVGSYAWKSAWGPDYHQSMFIGIAAFATSTALGLVVRQILIYQNRKLDKNEAEEMTPEKRQRIEEAARLEGLTFEEAVERQKGFRYLY